MIFSCSLHLLFSSCSPPSDSFEFSKGSIPNDQATEQDEHIEEESETSEENEYTELPTSPPLNWPFWMAFHSCGVDDDCGNPNNHMVHLSVSQDSYDWELIDIPSVAGSVPDLFFRNDKLYLYGMHYLYRYDLTNLEWEEREVVEVYDTEDNFGYHVDPNPILDEEGNLYLVFLYNDQDGDPAGCREHPCQKSFRIAKERIGSDGVVFEDAVEILSITLTAENQIAADPDLFLTPQGWTLLISRGQMVQAFQNETLVGNYKPITNLFENRWTDAGGVPAGFYDSQSEEYWTFVTTHINPDAHSDIFVGRSTDYGFVSKTEFEQMPILEQLQAETVDDIFISSPGFWVWQSP